MFVWHFYGLDHQFQIKQVVPRHVVAHLSAADLVQVQALVHDIHWLAPTINFLVIVPLKLNAQAPQHK